VVRGKIQACFFIIGFFISLIGQTQSVFKGRADVSQYDFTSQKSFELSGDWEFYWNQLLDPGDFPNQEPKCIHVPGSWHRQGYPTIGYATYRITFLLSGNQSSIA